MGNEEYYNEVDYRELLRISCKSDLSQILIPINNPKLIVSQLRSTVLSSEIRDINDHCVNMFIKPNDKFSASLYVYELGDDYFYVRKGQHSWKKPFTNFRSYIVDGIDGIKKLATDIDPLFLNINEKFENIQIDNKLLYSEIKLMDLYVNNNSQRFEDMMYEIDGDKIKNIIKDIPFNLSDADKQYTFDIKKSYDRINNRDISYILIEYIRNFRKYYFTIYHFGDDFYFIDENRLYKEYFCDTLEGVKNCLTKAFTENVN